MPTYEYECEKCACRFELKRRFSEDAGRPCCPKCRGKVRQLFSPSAVLFKGSGFYVTDSRNNLNPPSEEGKAEKVRVARKRKVKPIKFRVARKRKVKPTKFRVARKRKVKPIKFRVARKRKANSLSGWVLGDESGIG